MDLYEKIFDEINNNLDDGEDVGFSKEVFLYSCKKNPNEIDIVKLSLCQSREEFIEKIYVGLFNRLPTEEEKKYWSRKAVNKSDLTFQKICVKELCSSKENDNSKVTILNNIIYSISKKVDKKKMVAPQKKTWRDKLFGRILIEIYKSLPDKVKQIYKKIKELNKNELKKGIY